MRAGPARSGPGSPPRSWLPILLLALAALAPAALRGEGDLGGIVLEEGTIGLARDSSAALVCPYFFAGRTSWIAALRAGGLLVSDGKTLRILTDLHARSLAALPRTAASWDAAAALESGGIVRVDGEGGISWISTARAASIASGFLDEDDAADLLVALDGGGVLLLSGAQEPGTFLSTARARHVAAGSLLDRKRQQAVLSLDGGGIEVLDPFWKRSVPVTVPSPAAAGLATGDVDRDGLEEVLILDGEGNLYLLEPDGWVLSSLVVGRKEVLWDDLFLSIRFDPIGRTFVRGDVNLDGGIDLADAVSILADLFMSYPARARCPDALDTNDDGRIDLTDVIYCLNFLFRGGAPIPSPGPAAGTDPTPDTMGCDR